MVRVPASIDRPYVQGFESRPGASLQSPNFVLYILADIRVAYYWYG